MTQPKIPSLNEVPAYTSAPRAQLDGLEIAEHVDEYTSRHNEFHQAVGHASALQAEAARIDGDDRARAVQAVAAGKRYTPGKPQAEHATKVEAAARLAAAHVEVARGAHDNLMAALAGDPGAASLHQAIERHQKNRAKLLSLVDEIEDTLGLLDESFAVVEWLRKAQDPTALNMTTGAPMPYRGATPSNRTHLAAEVREYRIVDGENLRVLPAIPAGRAITLQAIERELRNDPDGGNFDRWLKSVFGEDAPTYAGDLPQWLADRGLTHTEAVAWAQQGVRPVRNPDRLKAAA